MRLIGLILSVACAAGNWQALAADAAKGGGARAELFVGISGQDDNPGTEAQPFATLERARDEVRRLAADEPFPAGGITVWIAGGAYERTETFRLGVQDSGREGAPVVWRAKVGENARLSGGRLLPASAFKSVTDETVLKRLDPAAQGKVLVTDLKALGITNFGKLLPRGFGHPLIPAGLELFFNDKPMTLARWPNEGFAMTGKVIDTGVREIPGNMGPPQDPAPLRGIFTFSEARLQRWVNAEEPWIFGYFAMDWADEYLPVQEVDAKLNQITLGRAHRYGLRAEKRFYIFNLLEELDQPGEWWLDRKNGLLYFWPSEPLEGARIAVSLLEAPLVELNNCSHVILRGLTLEHGRGLGVKILEGAENLVDGCALRNLGTYAVQIGEVGQYSNTVLPTHGGAHNGVQSCEITLTGEGGIILSGGDRKTLTPGNNFAVNNLIHHWSRTVRTYSGAVALSGAGNRVAHNHIHDAPHTAVFFGGNEHLIEFNHVHHVCQETADAGVFYLGRDLSMRGNVLRYNYVHDVGRFEAVQKGDYGGTMAFYLDDMACGTRIEGNIVNHAYLGVQVGGGRENVVENNIFANCSQAAVHFDGRGLTWSRNCFNGENPILIDRLKAVAYDRPPYSERYPELANILNDEPGKPKGNRFTRNLCVNSRWIEYHDGMTEAVTIQKDNLISGDVGLANPAREDFHLRPDGPAEKIGFMPIPIEQIGQENGR